MHSGLKSFGGLWLRHVIQILCLQSGSLGSCRQPVDFLTERTFRISDLFTIFFLNTHSGDQILCYHSPPVYKIGLCTVINSILLIFLLTVHKILESFCTCHDSKVVMTEILCQSGCYNLDERQMIFQWNSNDE